MGTYQEPVKSLIFIASASFSFSYLVETKGLQYSTWNFIFMQKYNFDECFDKTGRAILGEVALLLYSGFLLF